MGSWIIKRVYKSLKVDENSAYTQKSNQHSIRKGVQMHILKAKLRDAKHCNYQRLMYDAGNDSIKHRGGRSIRKLACNLIKALCKPENN